MQASLAGGPLKQAAPSLRRKRRKGDGALSSQVLSFILILGGLFLLLALGLIYEFHKESASTGEISASMAHLSNISKQKEKKEQVGLPKQTYHHKPPKPVLLRKNAVAEREEAAAIAVNIDSSSYLLPLVPVLPIFAPVENAQALMSATLDKSHPTIAGVMALLQQFLQKLHALQIELRNRQQLNARQVIYEFFELARQYITPLEKAYNHETIFPVRSDDSIFLSLAAYREHLLAQTMIFAFDHAANPEKLYIGAVVQNCFGLVRPDGSVDPSGTPCKTGVQVLGTDAQGRPITKVSDAPPDVNGIVDFCTNPNYKKYCDNGQVRVLYVHESESQGPAMARYYASRLWGGETYFLQCDSHLEFAKDWDLKYIQELKATRNYPKSVLSSYPPGFSGQAVGDGTVRESPGARLCSCETRAEDPNPIVRLSMGRRYRGDEERPAQIPFIAAGFFFARAEFLKDVPFDPYLPYCFMGEEIALSMRAWTHGWNIYAPRKNWIAHQYRPGRLGLPKFWETVNRLYQGKTGLNQIQHFMILRIKHMVGYPDASLEVIKAEDVEVILTDIHEFGLGDVRSWQAYMDFAEIKVENKVMVCSPSGISWCNHGEKD